VILHQIMLPSWSWSYVSWIYNDLCDQCISPLTLRVWFPLRRGVLDTTVCDKVDQWFAQVGGFRRVFRFSPPIKLTGTEILLKVVLNTITLSYVVTVPRTTCLFLWSLFLLLIKFTNNLCTMECHKTVILTVNMVLLTQTILLYTFRQHKYK
jgi:hypothetical protein